MHLRAWERPRLPFRPLLAVPCRALLQLERVPALLCWHSLQSDGLLRVHHVLGQSLCGWPRQQQLPLVRGCGPKARRVPVPSRHLWRFFVYFKPKRAVPPMRQCMSCGQLHRERLRCAKRYALCPMQRQLHPWLLCDDGVWCRREYYVQALQRAVPRGLLYFKGLRAHKRSGLHQMQQRLRAGLCAQQALQRREQPRVRPMPRRLLW